MKMGREYASALFTLAVEEGKQREYFDSLETVKTVFTQNSEYIDFLNSFSIPKSERVDAIEEAFGKSLEEHVVALLSFFVKRIKYQSFLNVLKFTKSFWIYMKM